MEKPHIGLDDCLNMKKGCLLVRQQRAFELSSCRRGEGARPFTDIKIAHVRPKHETSTLTKLNFSLTERVQARQPIVSVGAKRHKEVYGGL